MVTISDWNDLDAVRDDLTADYTLQNDLDKDTAGYTGIGDDFTPIGFIAGSSFTSEFAGSFDGGGFQISDLVIDVDDESDIGFFASTDTGSLIENLSVDGSVTVTTGGNYHGGLVGHHSDGTIQNCVGHVDVTSSGSKAGGLVGLSFATVTDSYATGSVDGDDAVGGLVGQNRATIQTSYAVGLVTGNTTVGALVGQNENNVELSDSYADEETTGRTNLTGDGSGSITNSYTLTTAEMQGDEASNTGNMDGFDFTNTWDTVLTEDSDTSADGYPILQALDRQNQLEAQGIYTAPVPFEAYIQINGSVVQIQSAFTQDGGSSTEITEAFTQDGGSSNQL